MYSYFIFSFGTSWEPFLKGKTEMRIKYGKFLFTKQHVNPEISLMKLTTILENNIGNCSNKRPEIHLSLRYEVLEINYRNMTQ